MGNFKMKSEFKQKMRQISELAIIEMKEKITISL